MLHYTREGSGDTTLVLLHGYCENNTCFHKQVLFFKDHATVISIDLPGFGKSATQVNVSIDDMACSVKKVLEAEAINTCIVFGHSMGGYVALAFADLFPNYLKGFGLIHSTAVADNEERKEKRKQVIAFIEKHGKEPYIKNFIPTLFKEPANAQDVDHSVKQGIDSDQQGIIEAAKAMMNRPDRTEFLKGTSLPVFFAIGKHDALIPEMALFDLAGSCQKSQIAYLKESAHMGYLEEADLLNKEMQKFIDWI